MKELRARQVKLSPAMEKKLNASDAMGVAQKLRDLLSLDLAIKQ